MPKQRLSITVDPAIMERARRSTARHHTSISGLVTEFLAQLPSEDDASARLTPTVRRLLGVATGGHDRVAYRRYPIDKYDQ